MVETLDNHQFFAHVKPAEAFALQAKNNISSNLLTVYDTKVAACPFAGLF